MTFVLTDCTNEWRIGCALWTGRQPLMYTHWGCRRRAGGQGCAGPVNRNKPSSVRAVLCSVQLQIRSLSCSGAEPGDREALGAPVDGTLFFAGEATHAAINPCMQASSLAFEHHRSSSSHLCGLQRCLRPLCKTGGNAHTEGLHRRVILPADCTFLSPSSALNLGSMWTQLDSCVVKRLPTCICRDRPRWRRGRRLRPRSLQRPFRSAARCEGALP